MIIVPLIGTVSQVFEPKVEALSLGPLIRKLFAIPNKTPRKTTALRAIRTLSNNLN